MSMNFVFMEILGQLCDGYSRNCSYKSIHKAQDRLLPRLILADLCDNHDDCDCDTSCNNRVRVICECQNYGAYSDQGAHPPYVEWEYYKIGKAQDTTDDRCS